MNRNNREAGSTSGGGRPAGSQGRHGGAYSCHRAHAPFVETRLVLFRFMRSDMQPFVYRSVRYWSKEINRTLIGGRIFFFLIRCAEVVSRAGGMLSIRGPQVSLGSPTKAHCWAFGRPREFKNNLF